MHQQQISEMLLSSGFNQQQTQTLLEMGSVLELPTRHVLTHQGQPIEQVYLLVQGICCEQWITQQQQAVTKTCCWPGEWILPSEPLKERDIASTLVETLTPCLLLCLPVEHVVRWRIQAEPLYQNLLEQRIKADHQKAMFKQLYSPYERYHLLSQQFENQLETLSLYHLAQCLDTTEPQLEHILQAYNDGSPPLDISPIEGDKND